MAMYICNGYIQDNYYFYSNLLGFEDYGSELTKGPISQSSYTHGGLYGEINPVRDQSYNIRGQQHRVDMD